MPKRVKDLSGLISEGRSGKGVPGSRSEVLASLLRKRAAAWQGGMDDLEAKLRNQILWSLPVETPDEPAEDNDRSNGRKPGGRRTG